MLVSAFTVALVALSSPAADRPTEWPGGWISRDIDPDRALSATEAEELVADVVVLLDKNAGITSRDFAAGRLVGRRHRAVLPALRFVMYDETDNPSIRLVVMRWTLRMRLPEGLGEVIPLLRSPDQQVRGNVYELLRWQYPPGREFGYDLFHKTPEENEPAIKRWEEWWEANKDTFELQPGGILVL